MPLIPAIRPCTSKSNALAAPIKAPPTAAHNQTVVMLRPIAGEMPPSPIAITRGSARSRCTEDRERCTRLFTTFHPTLQSRERPSPIHGIGLELPVSMLIAHATDLSGDDEASFVHAAAIASASGSPVISIYAGAPIDAPRPDPSSLARDWQRPIDHSFRCVQCCDEAADTVIDALATIQPSLVVVGTHARRGLSALLHGSVSEAIARNVRVPVLIVPNGRAGFVERATGRLVLERILIPAGTAAEAELGLWAARRLAAQTGVAPAVHLVHVGPVDAAFEGFGVVRITGAIEHAIVTAAHRIGASAIVMPTRGHNGIGDILSGTHTEHVVRDAGLPVLVVPS